MDGIRIIKEKISLEELKSIAKERYGDMVKGVVDVEQKIMAIGGELHADEEAFLLDQGSKQKDLWGISIYADRPQEESLEFDSVINLRKWQNNITRGVDDKNLRDQIKVIVNDLIIWN